MQNTEKIYEEAEGEERKQNHKNYTVFISKKEFGKWSPLFLKLW